MEKKDDRRTAMTKRMLKEGLLELLKLGSIHDISIRELCERADVNRSTFYKHYGSQYELLKDMENDWLGSVEDSIRGAAHKANANKIPYTDILTFLERDIELSRLLVNSNVDPEFPQKLFTLPSIRHRINELFSIHEKHESAEYMFRFYVDGSYNVLKYWLNKEKRESPEEMTKILRHIFQHFDRMVGTL